MTADSSPDTPPPAGGVLAALPRTRPQRASARRTAARKAAKSETTAKATAPAKAKASERAASKPPRAASKPPRQATRARVASQQRKPRLQPQAEPLTPKQGYEPEEEVELGKTVNPPSGGELVESLADIFGELAGAGMTAGGRLLKDALSIFRRP